MLAYGGVAAYLIKIFLVFHALLLKLYRLTIAID